MFTRQTPRGCSSSTVVLPESKARMRDRATGPPVARPTPRRGFRVVSLDRSVQLRRANRRCCRRGGGPHFRTARTEGDPDARCGGCGAMARPAAPRGRASAEWAVLLGAGADREGTCVHAHRLGTVAFRSRDRIVDPALLDAPPAAELVIHADPRRGTFRYACVFGTRLTACFLLPPISLRCRRGMRSRRCWVIGLSRKCAPSCSPAILRAPPRRLRLARPSVPVSAWVCRHCTARLRGGG